MGRSSRSTWFYGDIGDKGWIDRYYRVIRDVWLIGKMTIIDGRVEVSSWDIGECRSGSICIKDRYLLLPHTRQCTMGLPLLKDNITGNIDTSCFYVLHFIVPTARCIAKKSARDTPRIKFRSSGYLCTMYGRDLGPAFSSEDTKMTDPLPLSRV